MHATPPSASCSDSAEPRIQPPSGTGLGAGYEVTVRAERAHALGVRVLAARGALPEHAKAQVDQLIEGDLRGRPSHGMQRLPTLVERIYNGVLDPRAKPTVKAHGPGAIVVHGGFGFGPPAALAAVNELSRTAPKAGIAVAAIRAAGHLGMLAPYVEVLASGGLIGMAFTISEALVHPAGGSAALIGTNPIGIGIPAQPYPFVLDMSTAAISAGEVIAYAERGLPLPEGRAIDPEGHSTTDPSTALAGALSPFGGPKGYGLGLGIELLVAALSGSELGTRVHGTLDAKLPSNKGDVLIAIDPRRLNAGTSWNDLSSYLDELRSSPAVPGMDRVLIPGDRMRSERHRRADQGIPYPVRTWRQLLALQRADGNDADV